MVVVGIGSVVIWVCRSQYLGCGVAPSKRLAEFVQTYGPKATAGGKQDGLARLDRLTPFILALAIEFIVDRNPLSEKNRIDATLITTDASPTATS